MLGVPARFVNVLKDRYGIPKSSLWTCVCRNLRPAVPRTTIKALLAPDGNDRIGAARIKRPYKRQRNILPKVICVEEEFGILHEYFIVSVANINRYF